MIRVVPIDIIYMFIDLFCIHNFVIIYIYIYIDFVFLPTNDGTVDGTVTKTGFCVCS